MKRNLKNEWMYHLRSNTYEQGKAYLEKDSKYCCLGVLCLLAKVPNLGKGMSSETNFGQFDSGEEYIPEKFAETLGIKKEHQMLLAKLNDNGVGFPLIADVIEQTIPVED